jgi:hypothetical protein
MQAKKSITLLDIAAAAAAAAAVSQSLNNSYSDLI